MKKLIALVITVYFCTLYPFAGFVAARAAPEIPDFDIDAKAAIVMEPVTGRVLFAHNIDERLPIASTTKILTALIALEQPDIDAVFPVDEAAIMVEGSSMGLQKGDKASLRALAAGMLLASGNDAANATAVRIAGSIEGFVAMMNERALSMGLSDTSFETPSGLDGEMHYSTARELALIAREALRNDEFTRICSQSRMRTSYGNPPYNRWLTNHNRLLRDYEGTFGVKTGFTRKAGRCLVSAARRDGIELICITLHAANDWNTHKKLYEQGFKMLQLRDLSKDIPEFTVPVTGGAQPDVAIMKCDTAMLPVPADGSQVEYRIAVEPFLYAPVRKGQYLGEARIFIDGEQVFCVTLAAGSDVAPLHEYKEKKTFWDRIKNLFGLDENYE